MGSTELPYEALGLTPCIEKGGREGGKREGRKSIESNEGHSLRGVRITLVARTIDVWGEKRR